MITDNMEADMNFQFMSEQKLDTELHSPIYYKFLLIKKIGLY